MCLCTHAAEYNGPLQVAYRTLTAIDVICRNLSISINLHRSYSTEEDMDMASIGALKGV